MLLLFNLFVESAVILLPFLLVYFGADQLTNHQICTIFFFFIFFISFFFNFFRSCLLQVMKKSSDDYHASPDGLFSSSISENGLSSRERESSAGCEREGERGRDRRVQLDAY